MRRSRIRFLACLFGIALALTLTSLEAAEIVKLVPDDLVAGNRFGARMGTAIEGSEFWRDYTVTARFAPESDQGQSGVAFRYQNDRCYYFFGVKGPKAILKVVNHAQAFRKPYDITIGKTKICILLDETA